jgi:hypothetical protein
MFRFNTFAATTMFGLMLAGTAHAALTADQVWARWQEAAAAGGLALSAEGTASEGDALRLSGVTIRPAIPTGADDLEGAIAEVVLSNQSDGSVMISMSPEFSLPITAMGGGMKITQDGFSLTAREAGGVLTYDYAGAGLAATIEIDSTMTAVDPAAPPTTATIVVSASNLNGTYSDGMGATRAVNLVLNAEALRYGIKSSDEAANSAVDQTTELADVAITLAADIPATARLGEVDTAGKFATLLNDGLSVTLDMTQGDAKSTDKTVSPFLSYDLATTSLPGSATMTLDKTGFALTADGEGGTASGTSEMLPVPVNVVFGPLAMDFRMPVVGNEPQDFRYMVKMDSLTVNEEAWALFDPGQTLPRDPATLEVNATGKAGLDLLGLIEAEESGMADITPPTIESLDITAFNMSVAGAAMSGIGSFTFDNASGTPVPLGTADVTVSGANGLIDKLVTLGILPDEQATQMRMTMGMFLTPGDGDDVLKSTIEAKEGGSLFVNGMQIQ